MSPILIQRKTEIGVGDGDAQAAVAGGEDRHLGVAVDGEAADEVVGVVHPLGVEARGLRVDPEAALDRRRRRLARARRVDALHARALDERDHLAREVGLDVLAVVGMAHLEGALAGQQRLEQTGVGDGRARHAGHLAEGQHRARGALVEEAALPDDVALGRQALLEQAHGGAARARARRAARRRRPAPAWPPAGSRSAWPGAWPGPRPSRASRCRRRPRPCPTCRSATSSG